MKKIVSIILSAMLLLTVFTGCGSTDNTDDAVTTQPDTTEAVTAEDDADAEIPTKRPSSR